MLCGVWCGCAVQCTVRVLISNTEKHGQFRSDVFTMSWLVLTRSGLRLGLGLGFGFGLFKTTLSKGLEMWSSVAVHAYIIAFRRLTTTARRLTKRVRAA